MKKMKPSNIDGDACIRLLLDKSEDPGVREDAADSLMWYPKPQACRAMLDVILDNSETFDLRAEVAGCLGSLWAHMEYDENDMRSIPEPYKSELVREMNLNRNTEPPAGIDN